MPVVLGQEVEFTLDKLLIAEQKYQDKQSFTLTSTPKGNLELPIHPLPNCLWIVKLEFLRRKCEKSAQESPFLMWGDHKAEQMYYTFWNLKCHTLDQMQGNLRGNGVGNQVMQQEVNC